MPQTITLNLAELVQAILAAYPDTQAIYLFGSYATGDQRRDSDLDLAILLPVTTARQVGSLYFSPLQDQVTKLSRPSVDLINLRRVSTVFQHEIISTAHRIYCADESTCLEFEALTLSFYQELNDRRAAIVEDIYTSGRVYAS
jgi:predicted nucleotidyltransferase